MMSNKKKIAVVGQGTAGIQAVAYFLKWLRSDWEVHSIVDPTKPILGIGESTNPSFIKTIEQGTRTNIFDILQNKDLDSTIKLGTLIEGWREKEFINPLLGSNAAIHMNTFKLGEWAIPKFKKVWGDKFVEVFGTVSAMINYQDKAVVVLDGKELDYDFIIDCTGFPSNYDDYTVWQNPTNHGLVHNVQVGEEHWNHTKHVATKDGWMFAVPLTSRVSYGYMFNDTITDPIEAKKNFSELISIPLEDMDDIEYKFVSFWANRCIEGRIIKNGNKAAFFEPMFANSLFMYDSINKIALQHISGYMALDAANTHIQVMIEKIRENICFYYHGGSQYDTPFWQNAVSVTKPVVFDSQPFLQVYQKMQMANKYGYTGEIGWGFDEEGLRKIDENFEYHYFSDGISEPKKEFEQELKSKGINTLW